MHHPRTSGDMRRLLFAAILVLPLLLPLQAQAHGNCYVYMNMNGPDGNGKYWAEGTTQCENQVNHDDVHVDVEFQRRDQPNGSWIVVDNIADTCHNVDWCVRQTTIHRYLCIGKDYRVHVEGWVRNNGGSKHQEDIANGPVIPGGHHC